MSWRTGTGDLQDSEGLRRSSRQRQRTEKGENYFLDRERSEFRARKVRLARLLDDAELAFRNPQTPFFALREMRQDIEDKYFELEKLATSDPDTPIEDIRERVNTLRMKSILLPTDDPTAKAPSVTSHQSVRSTELKKIAQHFDQQAEENQRIAAIEEELIELEARKLRVQLRQAKDKRTSKDNWLKHEQAAAEEARLEAEGVPMPKMEGDDGLPVSPKHESERAWDSRYDYEPPVRTYRGRYYTSDESDSFSPPRRNRHERNSDLDSLAEAITSALTSTRIPVAEPSVFSGNPLDYHDWVHSFRALIDESRMKDEAKLRHLKRYLAGPALAAVNGYFLLKSGNAYRDAMRTLDRRFGNPHLVADAFRAKLDNWNRISPGDKNALRSYSDFLNQCLTAQKEVFDLDILDDRREIKKAASKLPFGMIHAWNDKVSEIRRRRLPKFGDLAYFVQRKADGQSDPWTVETNFEKRPRSDPHSMERKRHLTDKRSTTFSIASNDHSPPPEPLVTAHAIKSQNHQTLKPKPEIIHSQKPQDKCLLCDKAGHTLEICRSFTRKTSEEKRNFVKEKNLCLSCLKAGHRAKQCNNRSKCSSCQGKHPTSLHGETRLFPPSKRNDDTDNRTGEGQAQCKRVKVCNRGLTSMIVPVYLSSKSNPDSEKLVYALLDTQSDTTFVVESAADSINAKYSPTSLQVTTITDTTKVACKRYEDLVIRGMYSQTPINLPTTFSRNDIPFDQRHIPLPSTAENWPHLRHIAGQIAPKQQCPAGLLIGYDCAEALKPINCVNGAKDQPFAIETPLGWTVIGGEQGQRSASVNAIFKLPSITTHPEATVEVAYVRKVETKEIGTADLLKVLEQDFHDTGENRTVSVEDKQFLEILRNGTEQAKDGFYVLPLPFRNGLPELPNNRTQAWRRLKSLENQLKKNPVKHKHYKKFMADIITKGEAVRARPEDAKWYIPHHGVYHPQKPDKIRVVFDCSARHHNACLNDVLLQGPDLMNPLTGVLHRFRKENIAISCDIERMFHQFRVPEEHSRYLHFLWWEDGDLNSPPVDYRMKVHLFGAISSPAVANYALKQIAIDHGGKKTEASRFLLNNFYVDDGLQSEPTETKASKILDDAKQICAKGKLNLHKIHSNANQIVSKNQQKSVQLDNSSENKGIEKALGLTWDTEADLLRFNISKNQHKDTRRGLLATVASVYDPLGLIAPFILQGRQILQATCKGQLSWDDEIPEYLRVDWQKWKDDLRNLENFAVNRCLKPKNFGQAVKYELHNFSDASLTGYGQCSYLRQINADKQVTCSLVMAKARVAPLKPTTIPRLELQAAVLSAKIADKLREELDIPDLQQTFWTDSKVVLGYIRNEKAKFHIYVANRIEQIRKVSQPAQWHYVPTLQNPADHASRGLNVDQLTSPTTNWLTGPEFLQKPEITLPEPTETIHENDPEVKRKALKTDTKRFTSMEDRTARFSSYKTLINAISVIVKTACRKKGIEISSLAAREKAEENLIRTIQSESFADNPPPHDLETFTDKNGLLRTGGRLKNSTEPFEIKHPIILPKNSQISRLVTLKIHEKIGHQGRNSTMNAIRNHGFWIIGCRQCSSSVIIKCIKCIKNRGKTKGQRMADLPKERLQPTPPFTYCGLDVFGPFLVKEGRRECKRYGLIFTCLALRAVHIELLDDLTTDCFLNSLRCFIALRGKVRTIFCDCGTNFKGADQELRNNYDKLSFETISSRLLDSSCEFKFNPPSSSHMGGVWERQIRTVRSVLAGIIDNSAGRLDTSSLRTFFYEAAAIVNSRPLTVENIDRSDSPKPLSPNNLLTMKTDVVVPPPPGSFQQEDLYLHKRWRKVQFLANLFWKRWKAEYLQTIRCRQKWSKKVPNLKVDDLVILQTDEPRSVWKTARIVDVYPSQDKLVRKVKLLMSTSQLDKKGKNLSDRSYLIRPVHKLIPLITQDS